MKDNNETPAPSIVPIGEPIPITTEKPIVKE